MQDQVSPSDNDLVAAALRDTRAYALLVRRWEPPLARNVGRILGRDGQAVEDLLNYAVLQPKPFE